MTKKAENDGSVKQTTVEEGTQFKGTLQSTCQVMVRGKVEGDLTAPSVIVSESGAVIGNVKAESIRSEGVLAGHVDADSVYLSGSVRSDTVIKAKTLEVKLQQPDGGKLQVTFGECILDVGDDPRAEAQPAPKRGKEKEAQSGSRSQQQQPPQQPQLSSDDVTGLVGVEPRGSGQGASTSTSEEGDTRRSVLPPS
jgi:cytoskeletal protein CcmA (bactofilin family)